LLEDDMLSRQVGEAELRLLEEYVDGTLPPAEHAVVAA
jgi:hypothetical protein